MIFHENWEENITLTMEGLLIGTGWHGVEKQDNKYYRWTGPDHASTIHLAPRRDRDNRLNIAIQAVSDEEILQSLQIDADGTPLTVFVGRDQASSYLTAILPADRSKRIGDKTVFTIRLPKTVPQTQSGHDKGDIRLVGIAVRQIDIFELARPMFIAEKHDDPNPFDGLHYMKYHPGVRDAVLHGVYSSAYEYYQKNVRPGETHPCKLHERFDECPGDLPDILKEFTIDKCKGVVSELRKEMGILRNVIAIQNEAIKNISSLLSKSHGSGQHGEENSST